MKAQSEVDTQNKEALINSEKKLINSFGNFFESIIHFFLRSSLKPVLKLFVFQTKYQKGAFKWTDASSQNNIFNNCWMGTVPAERCAPCLPCLACPNGSRQIIPWGLLHLHKTIRSLLVLQVPKTHHLDSLTPGLTFKFRVSSPSLSSPFRLSRCHWNQHGCTRALQSQFLSSNYWWLHLTASNYVSLEKQMSEPWVWSQIIKDAMPYVDVRQEVSFLGDIMDLYTHTGNLSQMNSLHVNGFLIIERRPRLNFLRYFFPNSLSTGNSTSGNKCFFKRKGLGSHHPSLSAAVVQWCWKRGWDKDKDF